MTEIPISRSDVIGMIAIGYRDDLQAAVDLMPDGPPRWHLAALLDSIDHATKSHPEPQPPLD